MPCSIDTCRTASPTTAVSKRSTMEHPCKAFFKLGHIPAQRTGWDLNMRRTPSEKIHLCSALACFSGLADGAQNAATTSWTMHGVSRSSKNSGAIKKYRWEWQDNSKGITRRLHIFWNNIGFCCACWCRGASASSSDHPSAIASRRPVWSIKSKNPKMYWWRNLFRKFREYFRRFREVFHCFSKFSMSSDVPHLFGAV